MVVLIVALLLAVSCSAETLKEFLVANHVPLISFSQGALRVSVQGSALLQKEQVLLFYRELNGEVLVGSPRLLRYDRISASVVEAKLHLDAADVCSGSPEGVSFVDGFTLLSVSVTPSAECLLVLDSGLALRRVLYGFAPVKVSPGVIVLVEDMIHFAAVHPERLELDDLRTGARFELYPARGDELRAELAHKNAKHMPAAQTCARMNDPCQPDWFDEDIGSVVSDGNGGVAFLVYQTASHATAEGKQPDLVATQTVLYVYAPGQDGWRYCEKKIADAERDGTSGTLKLDFAEAVRSCTPDQRVAPDMSTAPYNPLLKH